MKLVNIIGFILVIYATALFIITGFGIGNIMVLGLGIVFMMYKYIYRIKFLHYIILSVICVFTSLITVLCIYGINNNVTYDEDAVIVLGCGLKRDGKTVSLSLEKRLEATIDYLENNKNAVIVVSGGQGSNENISEALAMEKYLVSRGVPKQKIIKEDKSTSTYENFQFSKNILDNYFDNDYDVSFITNNYHIYRAEKTSKKVGVLSTHYSGATPIYLILPSYFREILANIKYMFI